MTEESCGCVIRHVEAGEIVVRFCQDHRIEKDPFGVIPRTPAPLAPSRRRRTQKAAER